MPQTEGNFRGNQRVLQSDFLKATMLSLGAAFFAACYGLEITLPTEQVAALETELVNRDQYLEAIKMAGLFQ